MIYSVIGSNYGDEGKGLMTDYLSSLKPSTLVIRHNGGAQSGHTVEIDGKRFIFHELSSGSFRGADTYWAQTYYPDLYKLSEEIDSFVKVLHDVSDTDAPIEDDLKFKIFASPLTSISIIDDVFCNMLTETLRGTNRHGSCGMGINEACKRTSAGFKITMGELIKLSIAELCDRLKAIREEYVAPHVLEILNSFNVETKDLSEASLMYLDLLSSDDILMNYASTIHANLSFVNVEDFTSSFINRYDNVIFETGQGLLLDSECMESFPHVTNSRTGLTNIDMLLGSIGLNLDEAVYVTRSYLTKHGAGPFINEDPKLKFDDATNIHNDWQGSIRFGRFGSVDEILSRIDRDLSAASSIKPQVSLAITHLNESNGCLLVKDADIKLSSLIEDNRFKSGIDSIYTSFTKFSKDVLRTDL